MIWAISPTATSLPTAGSGDNDVLVWYRLCRPPRRGGAPISLQSRPRMPILIFVVFFMVRPAFPSAIERRTAPRSMWWYDPPSRMSGGESLITRRAKMTIGTVKWFNTQKGYGFIQPEDGSKDVFVHISAVERSGIGNLREGQRLSFELERGNQGKTSAVNLRQA